MFTNKIENILFPQRKLNTVWGELPLVDPKNRVSGLRLPLTLPSGPEMKFFYSSMISRNVVGWGAFGLSDYKHDWYGKTDSVEGVELTLLNDLMGVGGQIDSIDDSRSEYVLVHLRCGNNVLPIAMGGRMTQDPMIEVVGLHLPFDSRNEEWMLKRGEKTIATTVFDWSIYNDKSVGSQVNMREYIRPNRKSVLGINPQLDYDFCEFGGEKWRSTPVQQYLIDHKRKASYLLAHAAFVWD